MKGGIRSVAGNRPVKIRANWLSVPSLKSRYLEQNLGLSGDRHKCSFLWNFA